MTLRHYILCIAIFCTTLLAAQESTPYFTQWQQTAISLNLPKKFAALPWVLTKFDASFRTRHTTGVWALSPSAAARYGLKINNATDERRDISKEANAALNYLADLAKLYKNDEKEMLATYLLPLYGDEAENAASRILSELNKLGNTPTKAMLQAQGNILEEIELQEDIDIDSLTTYMNISREDFLKANPSISHKAKRLNAGTIIRLNDSQRKAFNNCEQKVYEVSVIVIPEIKEEPKPAPAKPSYTTYRVKSGDTLSRIASKYHVTVAQLLKWNKLPNADRLSIGQAIKIYHK